MPTTTTSAIKASGGDYTTIAAWEAAASADLVTADEIWKGECYDEVYDESNVTIAGSTTDSTRYKLLSAESSNRHDGTAGTGARVQPSASLSQGDDVFRIDEQYAKIEWLEIGPASGSNSSGGSSAGVVGLGNSGHHTVRWCLVHDINISRSNRGLYQSAAIGLGYNFIRPIVYDIGSQGAGNGRGILAFDNGSGSFTVNVVGATVYNSDDDNIEILMGSSTTSSAVANCKNNAGMTNGGGSDFVYTNNGSATINTDGNLSSDATADDNGDGTHQISKTTANQFTSLTGGSEDLHLKTGADAIGNGVDLTTTIADAETDIDGYDVDAGGDTWDIGADQFGKPTTTQDMAPAAAVATATALAPTLAASGAAGIAPAAATATATAQAPTIAASGAADIAPAAAAATATALTPTLAASGAADIAPSAATATATALDPAIANVGAGDLAPAAAVATATALAPTLAASGVVDVAPSPAVATATARAPTLAASGAVDISPTGAVATAAGLAPTLAPAGVATLAPSAATATAVALDPTLALGLPLVLRVTDHTGYLYRLTDRTDYLYQNTDQTDYHLRATDRSGP